MTLVATPVQGENVIAAEVHQQAANSSDVVFGLQLATVASPILSAQPTNQVVARTYNVTLAVSISNETLLAFQWRKNDTDIPAPVPPRTRARTLVV